jgi:hypothetical protein
MDVSCYLRPQLYGYLDILWRPSLSGQPVVLLEDMSGKDRRILGSRCYGKICGVHKGAVIDTALPLYFDIVQYGVS